ncbi:MAG: hypothetical protein AVDCRST_MAG12-3407, partial [uncultured Rubrobacteraceae bacterium]
DRQTGPADHPVRLARGVGGLARRAARRFARSVAQDRQEGLRHRDRHLRGGPGRGPVLRLDRQPGGQVRRALLAAAFHPPQAQEQVVAGQPREGREAHRGWQDEAVRPAGSRAGKGRRPVGRRLRATERRDGAGRPAPGVGEERGGPRVLRSSQQRQQVRDPLQDPGRQKARDQGAAHREVRGDARGAEEDLPL